MPGTVVYGISRLFYLSLFFWNRVVTSNFCRLLIRSGQGFQITWLVYEKCLGEKSSHLGCNAVWSKGYHVAFLSNFENATFMLFLMGFQHFLYAVILLSLSFSFFLYFLSFLCIFKWVKNLCTNRFWVSCWQVWEVVFCLRWYHVAYQTNNVCFIFFLLDLCGSSYYTEINF